MIARFGCRVAMLLVTICYCAPHGVVLATDNGSARSMSSYADRLVATKQDYPFNKKWVKSFKAGLTQYSPENRAKAEAIVDALIDGLIRLGEKAAEARKVAFFKTATLALNRLNEDTDHSLIETEEREELVALLNKIGAAANIDYRKYGQGEGLASWRDW